MHKILFYAERTWMVSLAVVIMLDCCMILSGQAATWHVTTNGTGDGTSWASAFSNIQYAGDAASDDDVILVSNGVYKSSALIVVTYTNSFAITNQRVTLKSVNGPEVTILDGNYPVYEAGVLYMGTNGVLDGFTVRNGYLIAATGRGGGVYAIESTITNCIIHNNYSSHHGGGVYLAGSGILNNSLIYSNIARHSGGGIGTFYSDADTMINNCIIRDNDTISSSVSDAYLGGGGLAVHRRITVRNTLFYNNTSARYGGAVVLTQAGAYNQVFENCTITSNNAALDGGGIAQFHLSPDAAIRNSIIYGNTCGGGSSGNDVFLLATNAVEFTCVSDTNGIPGWDTGNNIAADPLFVDVTTNNYRLASIQSPCFNAGTNLPWLYDAVDLDGNKRIFKGAVDMGAFEFSFRGTIYLVR